MVNQRTYTELARRLVMQGIIDHAVSLLEEGDLATTQSVLRAASRILSVTTGAMRAKRLETLTPADYAEAVTWLVQQLSWDMQYQLARNHIHFTSTDCPFGGTVTERESFCRFWCESFERIAADIFGYGRVACRERMVAGRQHCDVKVFVKKTAEAETKTGGAYLSVAHPRYTRQGDAERSTEETVPQLKAKIRLLEHRLRELEKTLEERKLIEKAKGILMTRLTLSESEAIRRLQQESQHRNVKLAEIARLIVQAGEII